MKVLVTGAAGFIGSQLVDRLLARGDQVIGLDNFDPFYSPEEKRSNLSGASRSNRFRLVEADVASAAAINSALGSESVEAIIHLASKAGVRPSISQPMDYVRTNVLGTQAMLDFASERGIRRVVFGSSSSVYGNAAQVPFCEDAPATDPISPYAATKRSAELLTVVHQSLHGGSVICLRFFTVYGPRQRPDLAIRKFCALMSERRPIPLYGDGSTERDYTWVDDILDGVVAALDRSATVREEHQIVNLGGSRTTSLKRLVELIAEALGVTPELKWMPPQPGDVNRTFADITRAQKLLGYAPKVTIERGIPKFVEWFQNSQSTQPA
jgi:UDP-glucuronate 4-epimerase